MTPSSGDRTACHVARWRIYWIHYWCHYYFIEDAYYMCPYITRTRRVYALYSGLGRWLCYLIHFFGRRNYRRQKIPINVVIVSAIYFCRTIYKRKHMHTRLTIAPRSTKHRQHQAARTAPRSTNSTKHAAAATDAVVAGIRRTVVTVGT